MKQSQVLEIASFHFVPLAITDRKYLARHDISYELIIFGKKTLRYAKRQPFGLSPQRNPDYLTAASVYCTRQQPLSSQLSVWYC